MITAESHNTLLPYVPAGAVFSDDMVYRYRLWRTWDPEMPTCLFLMLNPSTADHQQDDPTIRRCLDFARQWGYGRLLVGNLFALRATDPQKLRQHPEPTGGPDNDDTIMAMHEEANFTVAAWGVHVAHLRRVKPLKAMLGNMPWRSVYHLGLTKSGHPRHPLYLRKDVQPELWRI